MNLSRYPGAKGGEGVWQRIISEMPPHRVYIEAFLGSGVILRRKRPATVNVGIDVDAEVVRAFSAGNDEAGPPAPLVKCADAVTELLKWPWSGGELVYADPPYLMATRSSPRRYYRHEFTEAQHAELLATLRRLPCLVMLSAYWSPLYARKLQGWRTVQIPTTNGAGRRVVEWLWLNFPKPSELHDYRFLGRDFRERERIKRKVRRWTSRLAGLGELERSCLLAALKAARNAENGDGGPSPEVALPDPIAGSGVAGSHRRKWRGTIAHCRP